MQHGFGSASSAAPNKRAGASAGVSRPAVNDSSNSAPMSVMAIRRASPPGPAAWGHNTTAVPARHAMPNNANANSAGLSLNARFGGVSAASGVARASGFTAWFIDDALYVR